MRAIQCHTHNVVELKTGCHTLQPPLAGIFAVRAAISATYRSLGGFPNTVPPNHKRRQRQIIQALSGTIQHIVSSFFS